MTMSEHSNICFSEHNLSKHLSPVHIWEDKSMRRFVNVYYLDIRARGRQHWYLHSSETLLKWEDVSMDGKYASWQILELTPGAFGSSLKNHIR